MSVSSVSSPSVSVNETFTPRSAERSAAVDGGIAATLAGVATSISDGVSATVSFSGRALHALEQAGEAVVDGVEDVAVGAWHAVENTAAEVGHVGAVVVNAVEDGVHDVACATKSTAQELGHYAAIGLQTVGEGVSEIASGTVMAASAGGKALMTLI